MASQLALHLDATRPELSLEGLDEEERAVASALWWGRANARKVGEIAAAAGLPARRTQEVIHQLLHLHGWPIGTSMAEPFGNYLIDSAEDLEATVELLRARGISNLVRAAALRRQAVSSFIREIQTELLQEHRKC